MSNHEGVPIKTTADPRLSGQSDLVRDIKHPNDLARQGVVYDTARTDPPNEQDLADGEQAAVRLCLANKEVYVVWFSTHRAAEKFSEAANEFLPDTEAMEDEDFGKAVVAYRQWCEQQGHIYQQPARDVSGWLGEYVSLRNGGGQLALLSVDEQGEMQVVEEQAGSSARWFGRRAEAPATKEME